MISLMSFRMEMKHLRRLHLLPVHLLESMKRHLSERAPGAEQVVEHVGGNADEGGHADAVAQDGGPGGVVVVEQPDVRGEGQEADDDELDRGTRVKQDG